MFWGGCVVGVDGAVDRKYVGKRQESRSEKRWCEWRTIGRGPVELDLGWIDRLWMWGGVGRPLAG